MKKIILFILISILFTGCTNVIELNDDEEEAIINEMTDVILSHDKDYQQSVNGNQVNNVDKVQSKVELDEEKTEEQVEEETKNQIEEETEEQDKIDQEKFVNHWNFNDNIRIELSNYEIQSLASNDLDDYFFIEAGNMPDNSTLQVEFNVVNHSDEEISFDMLNSSVGFYVEIDNEIYKPLKTYLPNDMQFMNIDLAGKEEEQAILLYSIPKEASINDMKLTVNKYKQASSQVAVLVLE